MVASYRVSGRRTSKLSQDYDCLRQRWDHGRRSGMWKKQLSLLAEEQAWRFRSLTPSPFLASTPGGYGTGRRIRLRREPNRINSGLTFRKCRQT